MLDRVIEVNNKEIFIGQNLSFSHAGSVWDGALCLAAYWNKNKDIAKLYLENKNVLELGAGTGALGFASALFNPKKLYITDLQQYLDILHVNKKKNQKVLQNIDIEICPFTWGNESHAQKIKQIDTIIGSQLAYDKGCVQDLMKTLLYYKKQNQKLKIVISYQKYLQQGKNIQKQFTSYFGQHGYHAVKWSEMDQFYRDQSIGIIYIQ